MTTTWVPPRRSYHLRVFALALLGVVLFLAGILFGLRMEAITHATGHLEALEHVDVRAVAGGLVELGWYEVASADSDDIVRVRLDRFGNGISQPAAEGERIINGYKTTSGVAIPPDQVAFHKLEAGDILWPGQPLATIQAENMVELLLAPAGRRLTVPFRGQGWLAAKVLVARGERVKPGDPLAMLVPVDPHIGQPTAFKAVLELDEKHAAHVEAGQDVRLYSTMYNQRLYGHAHAVIERLEPHAEPTKTGNHVFRVHARVVEAPFPLRLGSTVRAEIVVGNKLIYRVILEQ